MEERTEATDDRAGAGAAMAGAAAVGGVGAAAGADGGRDWSRDRDGGSSEAAWLAESKFPRMLAARSSGFSFEQVRGQDQG